MTCEVPEAVFTYSNNHTNYFGQTTGAFLECLQPNF